MVCVEAFSSKHRRRFCWCAAIDVSPSHLVRWTASPISRRARPAPGPSPQRAPHAKPAPACAAGRRHTPRRLGEAAAPARRASRQTSEHHDSDADRHRAREARGSREENRSVGGSARARNNPDTSSATPPGLATSNTHSATATPTAGGMCLQANPPIGISLGCTQPPRQPEDMQMVSWMDGPRQQEVGR